MSISRKIAAAREQLAARIRDQIIAIGIDAADMDMEDMMAYYVPILREMKAGRMPIASFEVHYDSMALLLNLAIIGLESIRTSESIK